MDELYARPSGNTGNQPIVVQEAANRPQPTAAAQPTVQNGFFFSADSMTLRSHRTQAEIHAIRQALARTGWIRKRAARMLAISYRSLLYKIERYKITPPIAVAGDGQEMVSPPQNPAQSW